MKSNKKAKSYVWVERAKVISALRRIFRTYPPYKEVLTRCKSEWFAKCKNGNMRRRVSFKCEQCGNISPRKGFAVDHHLPVIDVHSGFVDYNTFVARLFCPVVNLWGLCDTCHKAKSKEEAKERALTRKAKNNVK